MFFSFIFTTSGLKWGRNNPGKMGGDYSARRKTFIGLPGEGGGEAVRGDLACRLNPRSRGP